MIPTHPTGSGLPDKSRQHLIKAAKGNGLKLRQNHNRVAPPLAAQIERYAHARQFKRIHCAARTLLTRVGRVHRKVQRYCTGYPKRLRLKICCNAPNTSSPSGLRIRTSYTPCVRWGWSASAKVKSIHPDRHCHDPQAGSGGEALRAGQRLTTAIRWPRRWSRRIHSLAPTGWLKKRRPIKPAIWDTRMGGQLGHNPLKGVLGDAVHAVMCDVGLNLCLILAALRLYCVRFGLNTQTVIAALIVAAALHQPADA